MAVTVSATVEVARAPITAVLPNGFDVLRLQSVMNWTTLSISKGHEK
jgi:hypothetical protein